MSNALINKLKNKHGISIVFALMFLVVASMVSVTILAAATSTAKRVNDDKIRTQDSLILRSATDYYSKEFADTTVVLERTREFTETTSGVRTYGPYSEPYVSTGDSSGPLKDYLITVYSNALTSTDNNSLKVSISSSDYSAEDVIVDYTMKRKNLISDTMVISGTFTIKADTEYEQKIYFYAYDSVGGDYQVTKDPKTPETEGEPPNVEIVGYYGTEYSQKSLCWNTFIFNSSPINIEET